MLYLTRKIGESVIINDNIEVTVIDIRGKSIKLGFTFPTDATVLRREIFERIQEENRAAANVRLEDITDLSRHEKIIDDKKDSGPNAHRDPPKSGHG